MYLHFLAGVVDLDGGGCGGIVENGVECSMVTPGCEVLPNEVHPDHLFSPHLPQGLPLDL